MKIAILIPTIKPGGAEKQAALLAVSLADEHNVHFVSFNGHNNESLQVKHTLENGHVQIHYLKGNFWTKCKIYFRFLKEEKIDVAFNYLTHCDVVGCYIERKAGVKTIYNGIRNSRLAPMKMFAERIVHNWIADYTIFNCYSGADYFGNHGYKRSKILVIPNCFPNISKPIKHTNDGMKSIVTVARFEKQKDYETTIRAIAELRKVRQDFHFTVIGHGKLEQHIRNWVKQYDIEDCTIIHIAPNNVQDLLKRADIYLSTSLFEGTSNSIMEAMNWSIPVVATNVGDNDKLIEKKWNGFLSEIGDYMSLAKHMEKLLAEDNLRIEMGLRGNERLNNYSVNKFKENYRKILK